MFRCVPCPGFNDTLINEVQNLELCRCKTKRYMLEQLENFFHAGKELQLYWSNTYRQFLYFLEILLIIILDKKMAKYDVLSISAPKL